jgi:hypothetical protein
MCLIQEGRDYEEVVRQMRLEIGNLRRQIGELETLTTSSEEELLKQCVQLTHTVKCHVHTRINYP